MGAISIFRRGSKIESTEDNHEPMDNLARLKIKINHVGDLSDARYCAGMQVHYLGFCVVEDAPCYVDETSYREITRWVRGPDFVLECERMSVKAICALLPRYPSQYIETTQEAYIPDLSGLPQKIILKKYIRQQEDLVALQHMPHAISRHIAYCLCVGSGDWWTAHKTALTSLTKERSLLVGDAISTSALPLLSDLSVAGVALSAQKELRTGWKTYEEMRDVLEYLADHPV